MLTTASLGVVLGFLMTVSGLALMALGAHQEDAGRRPYGHHEDRVLSGVVFLLRGGPMLTKAFGALFIVALILQYAGRKP